MGVSGFVAYMFDATAVFGLEGKTADEVLELLMEEDIEVRDILEEEETVIVYAEPDQFHACAGSFEKCAGITEFSVAELTMLDKTMLSWMLTLKHFSRKMIDALDDLEDVQQVYHNVDLGE